MSVEQQKPIELDAKTINETLTTVAIALDKAAQKGSYTLDEAYNVKIALSNVSKIIEVLIKKVGELNTQLQGGLPSGLPSSGS